QNQIHTRHNQRGCIASQPNDACLAFFNRDRDIAGRHDFALCLIVTPEPLEGTACYITEVRLQTANMADKGTGCSGIAG
ncbi:MAG: hypothetical protein OEM59_19415, partial [Rhodospirillales bacterium]|nr:hypothetical protein [Rhodospirillales bacterium]